MARSMTNLAEELDFSDPSDEQLKQMQGGEADTASVVEVNDLRRVIGKKIASAEEEGLINRDDAEKLRLDLQNTDKDKQQVFRFGHEVNKVIEESKQLISVIDDKEELALFKEMSLGEKRTYVLNLRKEAADLSARADKLSELLPGAKEKLKNLKGPERAKYLEELNVRRENIGKYSELLDRYGEHFSKKSLDEYMLQFKELDLAKQAQWIRLFEDTQAKPRELLTSRYKALPVEYRDRIKNFRQLARHEKVEQVWKAESEYKFEDLVDHGQDAKYMSQESREYAKQMFRQAMRPMRKEMMVMLKKHMKAEADMARKFDKLPDEIRQRHPDFYNLKFEEKQKILESTDKNGEKLTEKYEHLLMKELNEKVISRETLQSYIFWFRNRDLAGKLEAVKFFEQEMIPRRNLMKRFERELPRKVQDANQHFYELSRHERMELFEKLKVQGEIKNGKPDKTVQDEVSRAEKYVPANDNAKVGSGKITKNVKLGIAGSVSQEENTLDEGQIRGQLRQVKEGSSTMKKRIRRKNIGAGVVKLQSNSDTFNKGVYESTRKDEHLHGDKERRINRALVDFTDGKMVADTGHKKARDIKRVDLENLADNVVTENEELALKNEIINNQGNDAQDVFNIQITDKNSGQKLTAILGREKVKKEEKSLQEDIADEVVSRMEAGGRKLSKTDKEKLRGVAANDNMEVDLRATG